MKFLGLAASVVLAALAAWKAFTGTCALFTAKLVPLPELPFAAAVSAFAFCAVMTLWAAVSHLVSFVTRRTVP